MKNEYLDAKIGVDTAENKPWIFLNGCLFQKAPVVVASRADDRMLLARIRDSLHSLYLRGPCHRERANSTGFVLGSIENGTASKPYRASSRLYRSRFFQVNTFTEEKNIPCLKPGLLTTAHSNYYHRGQKKVAISEKLEYTQKRKTCRNL